MATETQLESLGVYFGLLAKWNSRMNLTSLSVDPPTDEAIDKLIVEPMVAAKSVLATDALAIDLGSGGGSPAFPLKIGANWLRLVMVEAKARKCAFLRDVARQMAVKDVEVANARFEELLTRVDLHESADLVTFRAVRADRKLWEIVQAFLKPGGRIFWFASADQPRSAVQPPLEVVMVTPLVPKGTSRLVTLRKPG